jgi:iron(III) transport system permease protein
MSLLGVMVWLTGVPMAFVFYGAVHRRGAAGNVLTLEYLHRVFLTPAYLHPLINTVLLAGCVCVVATAIGFALASATVRMGAYGRRVWDIAIVVPIFISPFIGALGWVALATPRTGYLNALLAAARLPQIDIFTFAGAVATMALYLAPYSYSLLRDPLEKLNPELDEAADVHGASWFVRARTVTIPLLQPQLLSSAILMFIFASEMFSIPGILIVPNGYSVLSYAVLNLTTQWPLDYAEAAAVGLLLFLISLAGIVLYRRVVRIGERFVTVGPRAARISPLALSRATRIGATLVCGAYVLFAVIAPLAGLALRSTVRYFTGNFAAIHPSFDRFAGLLADPLVIASVQHSLFISVISTALLLVISFAVASANVRGRDGLAAATEFLASTPIAIPGVLFGVGLLWMYIGSPVYASVWIIILVMLARFPPLLVRMFETALLQIGREVEEAATVFGATDLTMVRLVRVPLLAGTIRAAIVIAFTQVFNELTASALLFTGTSSVVPVVIYQFAVAGDYSRASALALLQIALLGAGLAIVGIAWAVWNGRRLAAPRYDARLVRLEEQPT